MSTAVLRSEGDQSSVTGADEVRTELDRLLSSDAFEASDRRKRFLQYLVDETLAGRSERLKGTTIAMDVFGRDETFNSQIDPVVRIEARRLRRDLDSFYMGAGADHPIRIHIPKGGYATRFDRLAGSVRPAGAAPGPAGHGTGGAGSPQGAGAVSAAGLRMRTLGLFAVLAGAIAAAVLLSGRDHATSTGAVAARPSGKLVI